MQSFEQELKAFFAAQKLEFKDNSSSFKRLDFTVMLDEEWKFHFDAKEKRQHYNLSTWQLTREQEPHSFIMDDLAARKILAYAPYSGMLVRDNLLGGYYFFSVLDLFLMPKTRFNRPIHKEQEGIKGKWMLDLRNGKKVASLPEFLVVVKNYIAKREDHFLNTLECLGTYIGENIAQKGEVRRPEHWQIDVKETR